MVQTALRTLEPRDLPIPDIDDDSAILRVEACGICGSDYEQFEGQLRTPMPVVPGHEPLGRIAKIGDRAAKRWGVDVGDRVAVETMLACRHCGPCLSGSYHLCDTRRIYSYIPLAEATRTVGRLLAVHVPRSEHDRASRRSRTCPRTSRVMFNPLGAGFRWAVEMPNTRPGDTVVILGPGQRGLASRARMPRSRRRHDHRHRHCGRRQQTRAGAQLRRRSYDRRRQRKFRCKRVKELTNGRGADIVVDVSAYATKPVADALSMVRPGGTVVLAGVKGFRAVDNFVSDLIVMKEINIKGAIGVTSSGYKAAIRLIESAPRAHRERCTPTISRSKTPRSRSARSRGRYRARNRFIHV